MAEQVLIPFRADKILNIQKLTDSIVKYGVEVFPQPTGEILVDMDNLVTGFKPTSFEYVERKQ